ncbi:hypothetical protein ACFSE1_14975 [Rhizobium helianthi]|uniref:Uncharacterized protein n=1 Tax=Rhizobium helianthi TaxID=1132695 RepID=A0ABW4M7W1_9HYPH
MTAMSREELEARINAHRELLIDCLAALLAGQSVRDALLERIREDANYKNYQEDPGAVPSAGIALENGAAREIDAILEAAKSRAEALKR